MEKKKSSSSNGNTGRNSSRNCGNYKRNINNKIILRARYDKKSKEKEGIKKVREGEEVIIEGTRQVKINEKKKINKSKTEEGKRNNDNNQERKL